MTLANCNCAVCQAAVARLAEPVKALTPLQIKRRWNRYERSRAERRQKHPHVTKAQIVSAETAR